MIIQFDGIDRVKRMLFFHLLVSTPALKQLAALIIYPERIHEQFVDLSNLFFCRLPVERASGLKRGLLVDQRNQFRLACHRLRQDRIACPHAVRFMRIASARRDLPIFLRQFLRTGIGLNRFTTVKRLHKIESFGNFR